MFSANPLYRSFPFLVSMLANPAAIGLRPSMEGHICQTSGATILDPGILRRSSTMLAGKTLKTGAGELARMTIMPFMRSRVFPISVRIPWVKLNRPRIAMIGIVRPTTARIVRVGRVIRFRQAKRSMMRFFLEPSNRAGDVHASFRPTTTRNNRRRMPRRARHRAERTLIATERG